jgi:hypothetical protein
VGGYQKRPDTPSRILPYPRRVQPRSEASKQRLPYGEGIYRRRILLASEPGRVVADLEDDFHRMRVLVEHDGERVLAIDGETARFPWTQCPGALAPLQALRGVKLTTSTTAAANGANPRQNCTHLFDIATLAVAHAAAGRERRRYDIAVPDRNDNRTRPTLARDGEPLLAWEVRAGEITGPDRFAGRSLRGMGFLRWAEAEFDADGAEAAIVLRRGVFISAGRLNDLDTAPNAAALIQWTGATCHSFTPGIAESAHRVVGASLEFSHRPDALLGDVG